MHTTQEKYTGMVLAILRIPDIDRHYQSILKEDNINMYILNLEASVATVTLLHSKLLQRIWAS